MEYEFTNPHTPIFEYEGEHKFKRISNYGLMGESFSLLSEGEDYFFIETKIDSYKGLIKKKNLEKAFPKTHYVCVRDTLLFSKPDIKEPLPHKISYGMKVFIEKEIDAKFVLLSNGLYGIKSHFSPIDTIIHQDYVEIAKNMFLGSPYLWGGRSPDGIDCSGVVQMAFYGIGTPTPRDSTPQFHFFTFDVSTHPRQRGDIVFWKGHVGMMVDEENFLHANAHHMRCVLEPFEDVVKRSEVPILGIKRYYHILDDGSECTMTIL